MEKRSANINHLLETDAQAKAYFDGLSPDVQNALMAHGNGVNTLEELKNFSKVVQKKG